MENNQKQIVIEDLYKLKSTEEALAFGKSATEKDIQRLIVLHIAYWRAADKLRDQGKIQEAFDYAFKKQLVREALEAAGIKDVEKLYR